MGVVWSESGLGLDSVKVDAPPFSGVVGVPFLLTRFVPVFSRIDGPELPNLPPKPCWEGSGEVVRVRELVGGRAPHDFGGGTCLCLRH